MNRTLDLFRRTSHLFTSYPVLWLPPILADVLRSLLQSGSRPLTRAALIAASPHSAVAGGISGLPSRGTITLIASGIAFLVAAAGLFFALYALGIMARAIDPRSDRVLRRPRLTFSLPVSIGAAWLRVCGLAAVFSVFSATFVSTLILPWMARARMSPASVQVVALLVLLPVVAGLFYLAVGVLRPYVLRQQNRPPERAESRLPYFLLIVAAFVLSNLAAFAISYVTRRAAALPNVTLGFAFLVLQVLVSAATAFPYAYAMTGLSLALPAQDRSGEDLSGEELQEWSGDRSR